MLCPERGARRKTKMERVLPLGNLKGLIKFPGILISFVQVLQFFDLVVALNVRSHQNIRIHEYQQ